MRLGIGLVLHGMSEIAARVPHQSKIKRFLTASPRGKPLGTGIADSSAMLGMTGGVWKRQVS